MSERGHTSWEIEHAGSISGYTDVNAIFPSLKSDAEKAYEYEKPPFREYRARSVRGWAYGASRGHRRLLSEEEAEDYRMERD